jgi:hypothetical protein
MYIYVANLIIKNVFVLVQWNPVKNFLELMDFEQKIEGNC